MPRRFYSSTAQETTLASGINSSVGSIVVAATTGFPGSFPYTLILDPDTSSEEVVTVTAASGTTLTVTRGADGTTAVSHLSGAKVRHGVSARDFDEPNAFINGTGVAPLSLLQQGGATTGQGLVWSGSAWAPAAVGNVTLTGTQTLTNKTLDGPLLIDPRERINEVAAAATGTINIDVLTSGVWWYTQNATANFTLNIRGNSTTQFNSILSIGDAVTVVFINTNGTTPFRMTSYTIDGSSFSPWWQGGTLPSAGNANSMDVYTFTIMKRSEFGFRTIASLTQFR